MTGILIRKGEKTQRHIGEHHVKMEATEAMLPQATEHQRRSLPSGLRGSMVLPTS